MEIPVEKNKGYIVDIIDYGYEGEGIAKIDDYTIFVPTVLKGEKVKIQILKILKTHAFGKVIEILKKSENRQEEDCQYTRCGGCTLRHIQYEETLSIKKQVVENCLYKALGRRIKVEDILGMENPVYYRNKLQYPLGIDKTGKSVMGIYSQRTHDIVEIKNCNIQNEKAQEIAKDLYQFILDNKIEVYNEKKLKGSIRHIVIKSGVYTKEDMVILVLNKKGLQKEQELVEYLIKRHKSIKTIILNINMRNTNIILGNLNRTIYGNGYIYDTLGEYTFKISANSFYQTNPVQTEILYNTAIEYAELTGKETVFDLYCGVGTIGIFSAKYAKKIYGIEVIKQAITDAKENSELNGISNIEFIQGEVEKSLPHLVNEKREKVDVVFLDPPRKGSDQKTLETLLEMKPKKIIYISCNPATLTRDLKILEEKYDILRVQPVDMFPFTSHIECVVLLTLK